MLTGQDHVGGARGSGAPRVLWLCGLAPHGVMSGLAAYTSGLTRSLAEAGATVHGLALGSGPDGGGPVTWTLVDDRPRPRRRAVWSTLPYIAARLDTASHRAALDRALAGAVDVVVLDHLMSAWCLDRVERWRDEVGGLVVHVAHNHETLVRSAWARSVPVTSVQGLYLRFDAVRVARTERRLMRAADLVTAITDADRRSIAHDVDFADSMVLAPGYGPGAEPATRPPIGARPRQVVLLGSFDWQAKRDNLDAVVGALDDVLHDAGIRLLVVGGGDDEHLARQVGAWRATQFLGRVPDASAVLDTCRIGIVAEPVGGGFKLKALDYAFAGLPMAVLDGSMQGIDLAPGTHVLGAATLDELAAAIVSTVDDIPTLEALAARTLERVAGRFEWSSRGRQLLARLVDMIDERRPVGATPSREGHSP